MIKLTDAELLRTQCLISGVWVSADDDKVFSVHNPTTGDIVASVPNVGSGATRAAITAAHESLQTWRQRTAKDRAYLLRKFNQFWHGVLLRYRFQICAWPIFNIHFYLQLLSKKYITFMFP